MKMNDNSPSSLNKTLEKYTGLSGKTIFLLGTILFFLAFIPYVSLLSKGIYGYRIASQGHNISYGYEAILNALNPVLFLFGKKGLHILWPISFLYQIIYLVWIVFLRNKPMLLIYPLTVIALVIAVIAVGPISKSYRTGRDIPQEVTNYLSNKYGADKAGAMKVMIERENGEDGSIDAVYSVISPDYGDFKVLYSVPSIYISPDNREGVVTDYPNGYLPTRG